MHFLDLVLRIVGWLLLFTGVLFGGSAVLATIKMFTSAMLEIETGGLLMQWTTIGTVMVLGIVACGGGLLTFRARSGLNRQSCQP